MTEITIVLPDWFLWILTGYFIVSAITTGYHIGLKRQKHKLMFSDIIKKL